ncbi:MAG TPA: hypothetical protein DDX81_10720 [Desulfofustis sp.]|jgi:OOP family OmpA-OmpF porin|nr:hypothetical protein [Desulfofustis sp.]
MFTSTKIPVLRAGILASSSAARHMALSKKRSEAVRDYLLTHAKLDKSRVTLQWYGKADPIASNQTDEGRALNRRVSVILTNM